MKSKPTETRLESRVSVGYVAPGFQAVSDEVVLA
jgi:hypothetical protein